MASGLGRLFRLTARNAHFFPLTPANGRGRTVTVCRTAVSTSSGGILTEPKKAAFGLIRIAVVVVPFFYVGALITKNCAEVLEEHDIFVIEDDDDD